MKLVHVTGCTVCPFSHYNGGTQSCVHPTVPQGHERETLPDSRMVDMVHDVLIVTHFFDDQAPEWCPLLDDSVEVRKA